MKIESITKFGKVKVLFSESFINPSNPTESVNVETLEIKLIPINPSTTSMLKFEWSLLSYSTTFMELQLTFKNPIFVSSDSKGRDILVLSIIEPNLFISQLS